MQSKQKKTKKRILKSFHPVRQFRLSDEVFNALKKDKKGTWNFYIKNLLDEQSS